MNEITLSPAAARFGFGGRIIAFHPLFVRLTNSLPAAIVLSQLFYWNEKFKGEKFCKTDVELLEETQLTTEQLKTTKQVLKNMSFLSITREGKKASTHYKIEMDLFIQALNALYQHDSPKDSDSGKPTIEIVGNPQSHIIKENNNISLLGTAKAGSPTASKKQELHPRWMKMAQLFHSSISHIHKVNATSKLKSWANEFYKLHTINKVPVTQIRKVLKWYCRVLPERDPYLPLAESGSSFRQKFIRIQAAMERHTQTNETQPTKEYTQPVKDFVIETLAHLSDDGIHNANQNELHELFHRLSVWRSRLEKALVWEENKKGTRKFPTSDTVCWPHGQSTWEVFRRWMLKQVVSWSGWAGGFKQFYPGTQHFKRYLKYVLDSQNHMPTKRERDIIQRVTKETA